MDDSVCDNQNEFNDAFRQAVKYNRKEVQKNLKPLNAVYAVLYLIFLFWAVSLALKVPHGQRRVMHVMFALIFPPAYVLAHYLAEQGSK